MGKHQRVKGRAFEQKIVRMLKEAGIDAKRILEFQTHMANGIDVETENFAVQCKCMKKVPNIPSVFNEIKETKRIPVVMFKVDRKGTYACFKFEDALTLMKMVKR